MLPSFFLSLREGLEAALIIGIVLGALRKMNRADLNLAVWIGAGSAVIISLLAALLMNSLGASLEGTAEQIFEGITMIFAASVLTWMIFWMQRQSRLIKGELEADVRQAVVGVGKIGLFWLAFFAVVREGVELALFLTATGMVSGGQSNLVGALLGLMGAIALGWALFTSTIRLNLGLFFQVTSVLLIFFAGGLVAHGVHEFNEVGWIPSVIEHVWDTNVLVNETSSLGALLMALFGYNANPSLTELLAYLGYFVAILLGLHYSRVPLPTPQKIT
jgi:high-affinity iron transporter